MDTPSSAASSSFYDSLPVQKDFKSLSNAAVYTPLPDDWCVGVADIVGSTGHIAKGRYKEVNTVGGAVISAQINAAGDERFPYVFGGDGASFAFPRSQQERVRDALARVLRWAADEFGFEMRGAIVPATDIRAAGWDVAVARYGASNEVDYAMFTGGGVAWAERAMKDGRYRVEPAPAGAFPDLAGLSCRWTPIRAQHGSILSVLALPVAGAPAADVEGMMRRIVDVTASLELDGNPAQTSRLRLAWPAKGVSIEACARRAGGSLLWCKLKLFLVTLFGALIFRLHLRVGAFDPDHYTQSVSNNADFRKYEDGLKMTLDCDAATRRRIEAILEEASRAGIVSYGLFDQDAAIMTCIVPSFGRDDHVHFVDGASGGYTTAAMAIKQPQDAG
ncbi:DUF3095 domain-containing protein [Mesorhizobium xinjiangense]|uniref:DUF3095 domain-containing protein n=1 Tax=Mesorhizobium xinjiangense TaxID=2678685 RepID=UPI0012ECF24C|nr:DUF3095 domain-containing protein [Mesorhizobium xinjiangense]